MEGSPAQGPEVGSLPQSALLSLSKHFWRRHFELIAKADKGGANSEATVGLSSSHILSIEELVKGAVRSGSREAEGDFLGCRY